MKKVQVEECIEREKHKLSEIWDNPESMMVFEKTSGIGLRG